MRRESATAAGGGLISLSDIDSILHGCIRWLIRAAIVVAGRDVGDLYWSVSISADRPDWLVGGRTNVARCLVDGLFLINEKPCAIVRFFDGETEDGQLTTLICQWIRRRQRI